MAQVRDAVLHLQNEQPLLVDLFALPLAQDACLICTNVRTLAGKRPLFVDRSDSFFLFPLQHIRFIEVPAASAGDVGGAYAFELDEAVVEEPELEIDEDLMRRIRES